MTFGRLSVSELIRNTVVESWQDAVFGQGGRMAFYHFLAIFPALLMIHMAALHVPEFASDVRQSLMEGASKVLPKDIVDMIRTAAENFNRVKLPGWRLLTTMAGALWAACNGTWAMIYGLNTAYEVQESRRPWQLAMTIGGLTIALGLIISVALGIVAAGSTFRSHVHASVPLGLLESVVLLMVLLFWFSILYRFAPSLEHRRWQWSTPGALLAAALWVGATLATRFYFEHVDSYHLSFGRLHGAAVLLLWLYVTNGAILIGGEMNSEIEKSAEHREASDKTSAKQKR